MATAEQMRRYRTKHKEKANAYSREYMKVWIYVKRQKTKEYETFARNLRKIDILYFIY
jgi:hypothetical protein